MLGAYLAKCRKNTVHSHNTSDVNMGKLIGKMYHHFSRFLINSLATKFVACEKKWRIFVL